MLSAAGYRDIEIKTEQYGSYIPLKSVSKSWNVSLQHPHCYPLLNLTAQELKQAELEYTNELEALATERGIWDDVTTYFVVARK